MADLDKKLRELDAATSIADDDSFLQYDKSEVTDKRSAWSLIKSTLKTYLDAFYSTTANIADSTNKRFVTDAQQTVIGNTSGTNTGNETTTTAGALVNGADAKTTPIDADYLGLMDSADSNTLKKLSWANLKAAIGVLSGIITNVSNGSISLAYASDTYLAGSAITIPTPGGFSVGNQYRCVFDVEKTAAGTASFEVKLRIGTTGTLSDALIATATFSAGTAVADVGIFTVDVILFESGGSTYARLVVKCDHHLASTGLISTGASGSGILRITSAALSFTTEDTIGLSVNGGASFSGTNRMVRTQMTGF